MQDYTQMSDDELRVLVEQKRAQRQPVETDFNSMSDDELRAAVEAKRAAIPQPEEEKGFMEEATEVFDKYGGAPSRKALSTLAAGGGIVKAASDFGEQFGEDPSLAPTGDIVAEQLGIPDIDTSGIQRIMPMGGALEAIGVTSPQKAAGLAIDIGADVTNLIPFGLIAKGTGKAAKATGKIALKGTKAAAEAATGGMSVKAGEFASKVGGATKRNLDKYFNPIRATKADDLLKSVKDLGIDKDIIPETIEFGKDSVIGRRARQIAEGPMGSERIEKFEAFNNALDDAYDGTLKELSKGGEVLSDAEAGRVLRDGFNESVGKFFDQMDFTYNKIVENAPGIRLDDKSIKKLDNVVGEVEKFASGRLEKGITKTIKSQASELISAVESYKRGNGTLGEITQSMREIGEVAYKTKGSAAELPSDIKNLRKIYSSMQEAVVSSVRSQLGDEVANALVKNNKAMSRFFTETNPLTKVIKNSNMADEKVFKSIVQSGDTKKLQALKEILPADKFDSLRSTYLENITRRSADGSINYASTMKAINKERQKGTIRILFDDKELESVGKILQLGDEAGPKFLSSSGTGGSNAFGNILGTIKNFGIDEATLEQSIKAARNRSEKVALEAIKQGKNQKAAREIMKMPRPEQGKFIKRIRSAAKAAQAYSVQNEEK